MCGERTQPPVTGLTLTQHNVVGQEMARTLSQDGGPFST